MAFVMPMMRKDYNLYGTTRRRPTAAATKRTARCSSTTAADTNVVVVAAAAQILSARRASARAKINGESKKEETRQRLSTNTPTVAIVDGDVHNRRRDSRRISIRPIDAIDESTMATAATIVVEDFLLQRRVRFGFCEEIEFDEQHDINENDNDDDDSSTSDASTASPPSSSPLLARKKPRHIFDFFRLATLITPAN